MCVSVLFCMRQAGRTMRGPNKSPSLYMTVELAGLRSRIPTIWEIHPISKIVFEP